MEEKVCQPFLSEEFLQGGIQAVYTPNPFDDEKGYFFCLLFFVIRNTV